MILEGVERWCIPANYAAKPPVNNMAGNREPLVEMLMTFRFIRKLKFDWFSYFQICKPATRVVAELRILFVVVNIFCEISMIFECTDTE